MKGVVSEKLGAVMYKIQIEGGWVRRHVDHIRTAKTFQLGVNGVRYVKGSLPGIDQAVHPAEESSAVMAPNEPASASTTSEPTFVPGEAVSAKEG